MVEYRVEFSKLSKFVPKLVLDQESCARRYEEGLNPHIKQIVAAFKLNTYVEVLSKALIVDGGIMQNHDTSDNNQKKRLKPSRSQDGQKLENQSKKKKKN
uniref:Uncharacterized protein n=1 Tax=Nelumbo nucifera TaxID=4432 RepID=A0A822YDI8_NELNU|nr:TPA_asm: hypothetical protein HUJ06_030584 [Nelumbo nucifera]